jgi:acyl-coenzyme A synthetase/AMP-(fatty) acid ligase
MNREEFLDRLSHSRAEVIDQDGKIHIGRDLFARGSAKRNSEVRVIETDRTEEVYVDFIAAVLGGGTIITGKQVPATIEPGSHYVSYTSGSTGQPKAIAHPVEHFISPAEAFLNAHGVNDRDTFYNIMPHNISVSLTFGMFPLLMAHGRIIIDKFNPFTTAARLHESRATMMTLPPGAYSVLARGKDWNSVRLDRMRFCLSGSNFVRPGYFEDIRSKGGVPLNGYGATEVPGNCTAYPHPEYLGKEWYPGLQYKVTDKGELALKWDSQPDYWLSGDMVEQDPVHGIKIVGRKHNMFKYLERKIYPEAIENLIKSKISTITECLVKLEDDRLVLLYEGTADVNRIRGELAQIYPSEVLPKRIQEVVGLPRTPLGKLVRT